MRDALEKNPNMSQSQAEQLIDRCMKLLFYRDARSLNKVNFLYVHWFLQQEFGSHNNNTNKNYILVRTQMKITFSHDNSSDKKYMTSVHTCVISNWPSAQMFSFSGICDGI